jgi:hypothetical protein
LSASTGAGGKSRPDFLPGGNGENRGAKAEKISCAFLRVFEISFSPLASVQIAPISGDCPPWLFQLASRVYGF